MESESKTNTAAGKLVRHLIDRLSTDLQLRDLIDQDDLQLLFAALAELEGISVDEAREHFLEKISLDNLESPSQVPLSVTQSLARGRLRQLCSVQNYSRN